MLRLTKFSAQKSSHYPQYKAGHVYSTASHAVDEMGGGACDMVLDMVQKWW
jgi:hypothetical protein